MSQTTGSDAATSTNAPAVPNPDRLTLVPIEDRAWFELLSRPDYPAIEQQIYDVGACENPVWLSGRTLLVAVATGEIVSSWSSAGTPFGAIPLRCMNRRATRCASCSRLYAGDAFQLVRAGLSGGKGVPDTVAGHPLVFATLTAPSFGPVHRRPNPDRPRDVCRARRGKPRCAHGVAMTCQQQHEPGDLLIGQPLCVACYDYPGHVLWNAGASALWARMVDFLYWRLARAGGIPRPYIRRTLRIEYVRVAEYQARGLVHFHAAFRLDGPEDRSQEPPAWATAELLADAIGQAASAARLRLAETVEIGAPVLHFGRQLDARPIVLDTGLPAERAAGYLAKYVTKGTEDAHGADRPITHRSQIAALARTEHVRALMYSCRTVGALAPYEALGLHRWTHMLGFGGQPLTKTRRYSSTFAALRQARADFRSTQPPSSDGQETLRDSLWRYAWQGWPSVTIAEQAAGVREAIEHNREVARGTADGRGAV
ncbi:replication initiation protein [Catenulispora sp. NL8]|uniref:Replication initiation protein n=1 Tax=Catenulispora pinistramenti TaxID=2705254 RepID=A0ABS5L7U5_9ACTN|nr:replication initiation protein [Catenulispora pinistramenti]